MTYGRTNKLKAAEIPFEVVQQIYADAVKKFDFERTRFPLTQAQYQTAVTAQNMLSSSKGLGGPQRDEVVRMLSVEQDHLKRDTAWLQQQRQKLAQASQRLDQTFHQLGQ